MAASEFLQDGFRRRLQQVQADDTENSVGRIGAR